MLHFFDGAMGTLLQAAGLPAGAAPESFNLDHPSVVENIHRQYIDAGSNIITTNSFGASPLKLKHFALDDRLDEINRAAVEIARRAVDGRSIKIAADIGPSGRFVEPIGDLPFDDAYQNFYAQARALASASPDYFILETFIDLQEIRAAILACKAAAPSIPIIAQMSFQADGRTVTGTPPEVAALTLSKLGAAIVGVNCSLGPEDLIGVVEKMRAHCFCPISCQPNAGLPTLVNGKTIFPLNADDFASYAERLIRAGASYLGGCCGTSPDHIRALVKASEGIDSPSIDAQRSLQLTSRTKLVTIDETPIMIGERINPTGRRKLREEIQSGSMLTVKRDAVGQVKAGASVLDVNMGVPVDDPVSLMRNAVSSLSQLVDVPLAIDTADPQALEAGLIAFPGRALINSVDDERCDTFLPLAKKYGAAIIILPVTKAGLPKTVEERLAIVKRIILRAREFGLTDDDFLADALTTTLASDKDSARNVLATLRAYRRLGLPSTMGLSNISFGLPNRPLINATFFAQALTAGLTAPIINPFDEMIQSTFAASKALLGFDPQAVEFSRRASAAVSTVETVSDDPIDGLRTAIINGDADAAVAMVERCPSDRFTDVLNAAMQTVGEKFSSGKLFLPQVLLSAQALQSAFDRFQQLNPSAEVESKGTVVLATVKGDVHDLGKNIVGALMKNAGFNVVDLGKDVEPELVVRAALDNEAFLIGLCALMTTTLPAIDETIAAIRAAGIRSKIMVGGAAVDQSYARSAGADFYAEDAVEAVNQAQDAAERQK
ncbi:MAG: homocysteine S-methyltransferase family protein [Selenomonadaceae bacterium]|nr:homocysteine S-methyltransferase family protein [Selenomonadaceae bacterium]